MHKLQHDRVVKLLGIILEDGNYSLVMEYVDRGNMMKVLQKVSSDLLHALMFLKVDKMLERDRMFVPSLEDRVFSFSFSFLCGSPASLETAEDS